MSSQNSAEMPRRRNPAKGWATAYARYAYETRRGQRAVFRFDDDWVVVYDACPYPGDPSRRELEIEALREWMAADGIPELAFSIWPKTGADKGYSFALVLDTVRSHDVYAALNQILHGEKVTAIRAGRGRVLQFVARDPVTQRVVAVRLD